MLKPILVSLSLLLPAAGFADTPVTFSSPIQQTTLIELYTSQGCSSCPPADQWLSTLKDDPRLWKEIIPVAFHVDYWDYLGWKDIYSKAEYSQRQRNYARWQNIATVYTPGFLQNGKEWRGWFRRHNLNNALGEKIGQLTVTIMGRVVTASFNPVKEIQDPIFLNFAWLGFDLETRVQAGENEGKTLEHDFVSYDTNTIKGTVKGKTYYWQFDAEIADLPTRKGAAFWVTSGNNPTPLQATGGWL